MINRGPGVARAARQRLLPAIVASAATGVAIYLGVVRLALPELKARLTPAQVERVVQAFGRPPVWVLGTSVAIAALLALPVIGVFRGCTDD